MSAAMSPVTSLGPLARRAKALQRLGRGGAVLAPMREGAEHGMFPLETAAVAPSGISGCYLLSGAGRMRVQRENAETAPYLQQHSPLIARAVMDPDGALRTAHGARRRSGGARRAAVAHQRQRRHGVLQGP